MWKFVHVNTLEKVHNILVYATKYWSRNRICFCWFQGPVQILMANFIVFSHRFLRHRLTEKNWKEDKEVTWDPLQSNSKHHLYISQTHTFYDKHKSLDKSTSDLGVERFLYAAKWSSVIQWGQCIKTFHSLHLVQCLPPRKVQLWMHVRFLGNNHLFKFFTYFFFFFFTAIPDDHEGICHSVSGGLLFTVGLQLPNPTTGSASEQN